MKEHYDRFQLLWHKRQRAALTRLAKARGVTLMEMTRQAIEAGIHQFEQEDEFVRRARALEKADALRQEILKRHDGKPLDIDPVEDLRKMREERIEQLASGN
ncbi:MAG: hypothetical protein HND47_23670 [Chloroflexi bacterium]|nr:hypothetical protein [Chloroflexota bacterium]